MSVSMRPRRAPSSASIRPSRRTLAGAVATFAAASLIPVAGMATAPAAQALDPFPTDYASWHSVDTPGGGAWTVTSDQNGDIWYADDVTSEVVHLTPGAPGKTVYPLGVTGTRIVSMAATPDGHIWLGDAGDAP